MLLESNLTMSEIGKMFNVSGSCVEDINKGRRRHSDDYDYPIRKNAKSFAHRGEKQNLAKVTEQDVLTIRNRYVNETLPEIFEDYKDKIGFAGFKNICYGVT